MPPPGEVAGNTVPLDVSGPACARFPQGSQPGSLKAMADQPAIFAATNNPMLSDFVAAVNAAGLTQALNYEQRAVTIFIPDNAAFDALRQSLGEQRYQALQADKAGLANLLKSHVVPRRNDRKTLLLAGTVTTLTGSTLTIKDTGSAMTVTDGSGTTAKVVCGNIPTQNALVYIVDKVLTPTSKP